MHLLINISNQKRSCIERNITLSLNTASFKFIEMRQSKYNIYWNKDSRFIVFNQLSGSVLELNKELYACLKENNINNLDTDIAQELYRAGILCHKNLDEKQILLARNKEQRYGNNIVRLTIMPTIDCNFRCWYCYENHTESVMSDSTANAILRFAEKLLTEKRPIQFHLDWFGGEPLLYFDSIIYPLSLKIKKLCLNHHVTFYNSITSNGYMIDKNMIEKFKDIDLRSFQITLDGEEKYHNKTRFTKEDHQTYNKIINNIELLCRNIENIRMTVRINYTVQNIKSIEKIADDFSQDVRLLISISPHVVWQHFKRIPNLPETIESKMRIFKEKGYNIKENISNPKKCIGCYTENMLQFVVNYDAQIYKCTARDFSEQYSIGKLDVNGKFTPTPLFFKYYSAKSVFERDECLQCNLLPSCRQSCIQKIMEGEKFICRRNDVEASIYKRIESIVKNKTD